MLTGFLKYNDLDYSFVFQEDVRELLLIPVVEEPPKPSPVSINLNGVTLGNKPLIMDTPLLFGTTNENHHRIVFVTIQGASIKQVNNILYLKLYAYFLYNSVNNELIDKLTFYSPEIDYIFNVNRAFSFNFQNFEDYNQKGTVTINTNNFDSTSSQPHFFKVEEKDVKLSFQIQRTISTKIGVPPLSLSSCFCFEFEATDDYSFIIDLCHYARNFIRFLCFRKNIYFTSIDIYKPVEDNKHLNVGNVYIFDDNYEPEKEALIQGRCIKYEYIVGNEGKILSDIVSNSLFLRHLPKSFEDGKHIDIARFIMITTAFEWEFHRNYPKGITKSKSTRDAEEAVLNKLKQLLQNSSGKQKDKYKFLCKLVKSDSMQSEIIQIGKDYSEIIEAFGKHLYNINQVDFKYSEIGKRVSDQRNHFAHGDLDKNFINESLLDVIFLEYIVYALQLKAFNLSDDNIRKSINDVFHLNFALK